MEYLRKALSAINAPSVISSALTASGYFLCRDDGTTNLTPDSRISRY